MMGKSYRRREFLGLGCAVGGFGVSQALSAHADRTVQAPASMRVPWPCRPIDPGKVRARAYLAYQKGGCMFGVFEAVAGSVADQLGKPYTDFPFELSSYGGGGVAMWGTLCGTCNGAAMAIALFHQEEARARLVNDVFAWYEGAALPVFVPEAPVKVRKDFAMPASRADSLICHVSITRWSGTAGFASYSPERVERCARLVADVAGYVAEALNKARGAYAPSRTISETAAGCLGCHAQGKQAPNEPEVVSRMACSTCHDDAHYR